jgi:hypothetical protein
MLNNPSNRSLCSVFEANSLVEIHQAFELTDQERQELMDAIHSCHEALSQPVGQCSCDRHE